MYWCSVCKKRTYFDTQNRFGGDLGSCTQCGSVYEMRYVEEDEPIRAQLKRVEKEEEVE